MIYSICQSDSFSLNYIPDGMSIPENRTKRIGQGSLEFSSIMEYDRGVYNCTALDFNRGHSKTMVMYFKKFTVITLTAACIISW